MNADIDYGNGKRANKSKKKKKPPSLVKRFFTTFFLVLTIFFVVGTVAVYGYSYYIGNNGDIAATAKKINSNLKSGGSITDLFSKVPEHTNFLIIGVDEDGNADARTDVTMVGCFNSTTEKLTLISVPRDTKVIMPQDRLDILTAAGRTWAPSSGVMKLTEVSHYAGADYSTEFTTKQIEELMGIEITYYVKVDLTAFKYLVDELGGVEFDVPQRMFYEDPVQDLYIDLYPGVQVLNGEQAEQLVRYRKPSDTSISSELVGDTTRETVQQDFMKAVIKTALEGGLATNGEAMLKTFINYVDTNFPLTDAPKYLTYASSFSVENIETCTLPGEDVYTNKWYFIVDEAATAELVDEVFYGGSNTNPATENTVSDSKGLRIQVLNGGYTTGLAAKTKESLESLGYTVSNINDYNGTKASYTRIYVKEDSVGKDLQALFEDSEIILDSSQSGYDIVIVLGTDTEAP